MAAEVVKEPLKTLKKNIFARNINNI